MFGFELRAELVGAGCGDGSNAERGDGGTEFRSGAMIAGGCVQNLNR